MSGESMILDNAKHIYHSIPMDVPGPVTLTDQSRCCRGSRKVMTLILASALLWVIVLDIILVVYKSHHLGSSSHKEHLDSRLASGVMIMASPVGAVPSVDGTNQPRFATPPPHNVTDAVTKATSVDPNYHQTGDASPDKDVSKRDDSGILPGRGMAIPSLQSWLARLRHKPEPPAPMPSLMSSAPLLPLPAEPMVLQRQTPGRGQRAGRGQRPGRGWQMVRHPDKVPKRLDLPSAVGKLPSAVGKLLSAVGKLPPPDQSARKAMGSEKLGQAAPPESAFLVRFFSAIVDAPWNMTSGSDSGYHRPQETRAPPPPPFFPSQFMRLLRHPDSDDSDDSNDDPDETVIDLDLSD